MADKWTQTLIPTSRQVPAEAEVPSHQLMLRAGLIRKLAAGSYAYLPLGLRSLNKACEIIRQEMNAAGAVEVLLPALQPIELWEQSKRREAYGQNLFVLKDRHGREQALGPTHEEVVTDIIGAYAKSYKDLPLTLYQIQTKFRDEFRPRFGVLRSREFQMKDAYSFHTTLEGSGSLDETYQKQYGAYQRIFTRCGLPFEIVEAESGPIGGSASHEFMVPSPTGEDVIFKSDKGNYAANVEKCATGERAYTFDAEPVGEMEEVETPDCRTIDQLTEFWRKEIKSKLKASNILKTLVYKTDWKFANDGRPIWLVAVVRADHEVNEGKLRAAIDADENHWFHGQGSGIQLAEEAEALEAGFSVGFVGPQLVNGRQDVHMIVDPDAAQGGFWVVGANKKDRHARSFCWKRDISDFERMDHVVVADIRNAVAGDPSPKNDGGVLTETHGIEIGHVFKLGTKYTDAFNVKVLGENNEPRTVYMGCYGIGVNRLLASAIEAEGGHDEDGIIWPAGLAPYRVLITPIKYDGEAKEVVDDLAAKLEATGLDVLIDDRDERPGVKFKDADLIGIPLRVTVGEKGLAGGKVEIKTRDGSMGPRGEEVAIDQALERIRSVFAKN